MSKKLSITVIRQHVKDWYNADASFKHAGQQMAADCKTMIDKTSRRDQVDSQLSVYAGVIHDAAPSDAARNNKLSAFRGELKRQAKALELDQFPTVKRKDGSYHAVWNDFPAEDSLKAELNKAHREFIKDPSTDTMSAYYRLAQQYADVKARRAIAIAEQQLDKALSTSTDFKVDESVSLTDDQLKAMAESEATLPAVALAH